MYSFSFLLIFSTTSHLCIFQYTFIKKDIIFFDICFKIYNCSIISTRGTYLLASSINATTSPCIWIKGDRIELNGNSSQLIDSSGSNNLVGIRVEGQRHYIHDIGFKDFGISIDMYLTSSPSSLLSSSSSSLLSRHPLLPNRHHHTSPLTPERYSKSTYFKNIGLSSEVADVDLVGIRATGAVDLQIENFGSSPNSLTSSNGTAIGLQFINCNGFWVGQFGLTVESTFRTTGIHILSYYIKLYLSLISRKYFPLNKRLHLLICTERIVQSHGNPH